MTTDGMVTDDTIVAISSAVGPAPRMLVRTSGGLSLEAASRLGAKPEAGPTLQTLHIEQMPVPAVVLAFPAGRSPTGQAVVEYHLPGNPLLCRLVVDALVRLGCRRAEAGEFTARAFFAGRMDLAQAEGVAATIAAANEAELAAARQLAGGELSHRLRPSMENLGELLALTEVGIDFTEEQVTFISDEETSRRLSAVDAPLAELLAESGRLEDLRHTPTVVLAGRPNAGKSTLLNALAGTARAVVSAEAGTTRDVLSAEVSVPGGMVRLLDAAGVETAGVEPAGVGPAEVSAGDAARADIDRQMQARAATAVEQADVLVHVAAADDARPRIRFPRPPDLLVTTKADLVERSGRGEADLCVSAVTGEGLMRLREAIGALAFTRGWAGERLALNGRHVEAIGRSRDALARAAALVGAGPELLAVELRLALDALGDVLGQMTPDDVLGRVFARFCIGK